MTAFLPFEKPIEALASSAGALRAAGNSAEATMLDERVARQLADLYARLTPAQRVEVARHPERPHFAHFAEALFEDFTPLAGDRGYADDAAIIGGLARLRGRKIMVVGHAKGEDTASRLHRNFGMAKPEGYRKAIRLLDLADRFGIPVVTLIDTPGAFPGLEAEERGQAEAIARCTERCLALRVPLISVITGEGGSGGAIALAAGNRILMLEHAIFSVISPEGCASILWRTAERASEAAEAMKLTATDLLRLGVIHRIVYEPAGGAHRNHDEAIKRLGMALETELDGLTSLGADDLRAARRGHFLRLGAL